MTEIVDDVIREYGGIPNIVSRFKYKEPMAVYNWRSRGIPVSKIADIHLDTGISVARLMLASSARRSVGIN